MSVELALQHAIAIIESYQTEIRDCKKTFGIDLLAVGFCQGRVYRAALQDIESEKARSGRALCDHKYVFLRQEDYKEGGYRPIVFHLDVYFCERCLTYQKVKAAESAPNGCDSGYTRRSLV